MLNIPYFGQKKNIYIYTCVYTVSMFVYFCHCDWSKSRSFSEFPTPTAAWSKPKSIGGDGAAITDMQRHPNRIIASQGEANDTSISTIKDG